MSKIAIFVHATENELGRALQSNISFSRDNDKDGHASISKLIGEGYQIITLLCG